MQSTRAILSMLALVALGATPAAANADPVHATYAIQYRSLIDARCDDARASAQRLRETPDALSSAEYHAAAVQFVDCANRASLFGATRNYLRLAAAEALALQALKTDVPDRAPVVNAARALLAGAQSQACVLGPTFVTYQRRETWASGGTIAPAANGSTDTGDSTAARPAAQYVPAVSSLQTCSKAGALAAAFDDVRATLARAVTPTQ